LGLNLHNEKYCFAEIPFNWRKRFLIFLRLNGGKVENVDEIMELFGTPP